MTSAIVIERESWGVAWHVELERSLLIPGTLVNGRVRISAPDGVQARALVVGLTGVEHWRHRVTRTDGQGHMTTEVVRTEAEPVREPVTVEAPIALGPGKVLDRPFQLPIPPDGPASLAAEDAGMTWTFEAKLDIEGSFDSGVDAPVVVAQPTALLRVGAVPLSEFALYDSVDVASDEVTGTLTLAPMPLVCGEAFTASLTIASPPALSLQEVRAEVRLRVEATVSQGEGETVTAWARHVAPQGSFGAGQTIEMAGTLPTMPLPSIELPHGRTTATFHVILARAWAIDTHLVRDVAMATTREV